MVKINLSIKRIEVDYDNFDKEMEQKLWKIGETVVNEIQLKIRQMGLVDTSRFHNSIDFKIIGGELYVHDGVEYGKYLEYGTMAHMVKPISKKALHWLEGNKDAFSKGHMVSGIKAYAPFRRGIISSLPEIRRILAKE